MNFFEHQELARRASRRLIVLFALAVIAVIVAVNAAGALAYLWATGGIGGGLPRGFFATNTAIVLALIGGGTLWEIHRLSAGGEVVAQMVGARAVDPGTRDLLERRLLNVVEEMALASGVAVPRVYVLDSEATINAFAAGHSVNDAVIAVTRGALTRLTRDELQGVIGHEFSHVLNGDMRLNMRLIGVLFGLLMMAMFGRFLIEIGRGSRADRRGGAAPLLIAGLLIWIVGYVGVFFGRLIKAGVSRQREFLADAAAVQFTRNPDGIGGALRKIGWLSQQEGLGTAIAHPNAENLSHMFLGAARRSFAAGLFATHPPLAERVRRIYGRRMEFVPAPEQPLAVALAAARDAEAQAAPTEFVSPVAALVAGSAQQALAVPEAIGGTAPGAKPLAQRLEDPLLRAALADSGAAQLLVLALLIDKDGAVAESQRRALAEAFGAPAVQTVDEYHAQVQRLPPGLRLPLVDRLMPTLRKLPPQAAQRLLALAHTLIAADGRVTLAEFLLFTVLKRRLGPAAHSPVPVRYASVAELPSEAALVLSLVAAVRLPEAPERAFNAGLLLLPGVEAELVPPAAIALDAVDAALARLNQLAPLAKPAVIKAATAAAFVDGQTNWKAASCLRTICAALDAPLPPQLSVASEAWSVIGDIDDGPHTTVNGSRSTDNG